MIGGTYILKGIEKIDYIGGTTYLMEATFENGESALMYGDYATTIGYISQNVVVTIRQESIKGKSVDVIDNFTIITKVNALPREKRVKLFIDGMPPIDSSVNFRDINIGDISRGAIVYCTSHTYDSNNLRDWAKLTIMDKNRNVSTLRFFNPDSRSYDFTGNYIKVISMKRTEFGFNTQEDIQPVDDRVLVTNPEIEISERFIMEAIKDDDTLIDYMKFKNLMDSMKRYRYEENLEVGYIVVRTAMEIAQAKELENMTPLVDIELLIRAIIISKSFTITNNPSNTRSIIIQNVMHLCSRPSLASDKRLFHIIEIDNDKNLLEKNLMRNISEMVSDIIKGRKDINQILSTDRMWRNI